MVFELKTLKDTENLAKNFAKKLKENDLVLLKGELGSGKTTFAKYLVKALGFPHNDVSSPSFTIVQEYIFKGKKIYHIDLYRIEKESELYEIGLEEILSGDSLVIVEWPEIGEFFFETSGRRIFKIIFDFKNGKRRANLTNLDI
jgi:tRNA threonylcarbamoyladenosine biosynthesis protein TsaE